MLILGFVVENHDLGGRCGYGLGNQDWVMNHVGRI